MAQILKTDGAILPLHDLTLEALQAAVGGDIEAAFTHDGLGMFLNENGKIEGLSLNTRATQLYRLGQYDSIVGDVVLLTAEETLEEFGP